MTNHRLETYRLLRPSTPGCLLLAAVLGTAGCDNNNNNGIIAPTPPPSITESVSGNLTPFSARIHYFPIVNAGAVTASLTELIEPNPDPSPDNPTVVGLDIGTAVGTACQVVVSRTDVFKTQGVAAQATAPGTLCIRIYDVSSTGLPASVDYTVTVTHF